MPDPERVPPGPLRDLVQAVHELYRGAGKPGLRVIARATKGGDYNDTVSHEKIGAILRGDGLPRWSKLNAVVRVLAEWHTPRRDADAEAARVQQLWYAVQGDATPPPTGAGHMDLVDGPSVGSAGAGVAGMKKRYDDFIVAAENLLERAGLARDDQTPVITGRAFREACVALAMIHFPEDKEVNGMGPKGLLWRMYPAVDPPHVGGKVPDPVSGAKSVAEVLKQIIENRPPLDIEEPARAEGVPPSRKRKAANSSSTITSSQPVRRPAW